MKTNESQICGLLDLVRDRLVPLIETEEQMIKVSKEEEASSTSLSFPATSSPCSPPR